MQSGWIKCNLSSVRGMHLIVQVYVRESVCMCMCACVCVCMCVCMYVCVCVEDHEEIV